MSELVSSKQQEPKQRKSTSHLRITLRPSVPVRWLPSLVAARVGTRAATVAARMGAQVTLIEARGLGGSRRFLPMWCRQGNSLPPRADPGHAAGRRAWYCHRRRGCGSIWLVSANGCASWRIRSRMIFGPRWKVWVSALLMGGRLPAGLGRSGTTTTSCRRTRRYRTESAQRPAGKTLAIDVLDERWLAKCS